MDERPKFQFKLLAPGAKLPQKHKDTDACYDVYALESQFIWAGKTGFVRTGLALAAPPGWYYTIEGRSSLFLRGVVPMRGVIDSCYTGEVLIGFANLSPEGVKIEAGDRIAQLAIHKVHTFEAEEVDEFGPEYSIRGTAGWGSSGT